MDERPLFGAGSAPAKRPAVKRARPASPILGREARGTVHPAGYAPQTQAPQTQAHIANNTVAQGVIPQVPVPQVAPPVPPVPQQHAVVQQPVAPQTAPPVAPPAVPETAQHAYHQHYQHPASQGVNPPVPPLAGPAGGPPQVPVQPPPQPAATIPPQQPAYHEPAIPQPGGPAIAVPQSVVTAASAMPPVPDVPHVPGTTGQPMPVQPQLDPANQAFVCGPAGFGPEAAMPQSPQALPAQNVPVEGQLAIHVATHGQPANNFVAPAPPSGQIPVMAQNPATLEPNGTAEDRKSQRHRALKGGMIILQGQMMSSFKCKIRNESRGGVMITLSNAAEVPDEFYLVRDSDPGNRVPCRVAWRAHDRLGAMFVPALTGM